MSLADLGGWLARQAAADPALATLHPAFCQALLDRGLPVWRSTLGLETLHPEISGTQLIWLAGTLKETEAERRGILTRPDYVSSPTRIVDESGRPFRRRLDRPVKDLPLLEELRGRGATDYAMFPLPFIDQSLTSVISFATLAPGGFADAQLAELEDAARLLSPYAERQVLRRIAIDLLDTYVGHSAGEKVFAGQVQRGDIESIYAAVWFCDLRGFTRFSDREPRETVIDTLNDWFDCMAEPIAEAGGEILKFMGDGLLAIFPLSKPTACGDLLRAIGEAQTALAQLNDQRLAAGRDALNYGIGVHVGEVMYGNIGSRNRLDFTVIGPAVNIASRLESLTKEVKRPVLFSQAFVEMACCKSNLEYVGSYPLRGLGEPVTVFALSAGEVAGNQTS
jgi:adenylate cyclase